jgi:glutathione S-transferase
MQLFGALASPYVARVFLFARLKGLELHPVMPPGGIKTTDFLARNPMGRMPVLEFDGASYAESMVICELLEDLYPGTGGLPGTPRDRALARTITQVHDAYLMPHLSVLWRCLDPATRDETALAAAREGFESAVDFLEHYVQAAPFAAGSRPSFGDCTLLPSIVIMQKTVVPALGIADLATGGGNIARCWRTLESDALFGGFLPAYRQAVDELLRSFASAAAATS